MTLPHGAASRVPLAETPSGVRGDPAAPAIRVRGLRRTYGQGPSAYEAVRGVDLDVPAGSITALLGTNGAGKTSTLEVIEGLAEATHGEARVLGLDPLADRAALRRRTGVLLQRSGFSGDLTVRETLRLWSGTLTSPRPVDEMLGLLSLEDRSDVRMVALSGGETRRVDLACTLMGDPELVFLDEPTTGLDPESRRDVWRLVSDLRDRGATVLITTHYLEEAETLADRLEIMHAGRIVRSGTPTEIAAGYPSTISFAPVPDLPGDLAAVRRVVREHARTTLETDALQDSLHDLLAWAASNDVALDDLDARSPSLEAVFLSIADGRDPVGDARRHDGRSCASRTKESPMTTTTGDGFSIRRAASLTRWNAVLLSRNRMAFLYAAVFPLLPLALLFTGDRGDESMGAGAMTTTFLVAALFTVYYNVLSQFVSRRDELVLKRMRTGEAQDGELLLSIALPGALSALLVFAIVVPLAAALGQPLPLNPVLYVASAALVIAMFTAFAYWTAAWTRNAEAAQLTSLPLILLASAGPLTASSPDLSDPLREILSRTPGAAMSDLVRIGWFGLDGPGATEANLTFAATWSQATGPLFVIAAWTLVAVSLARRSIRWEPRS